MTEELKQQEQHPEATPSPSEDSVSSSPTPEAGEPVSTTDPVDAQAPAREELSDEDILKELEQNAQPEDQSSDATELEAVIGVLQQEIASLKSQLDQQVQQADSYKAQYVRLAADFENFRKRTTTEQENLEYQVKKNTITELLGAIDSFERARSQIKPANDGEMTIHKSYQGVYKQLVDGLKRIGVSAMKAEGEPFDPNYHEAVFREPNGEHPEDTVLEQVVRGYLLHERVLRHAMVKVAAPPEEDTDLNTASSAPDEGSNPS